MDITVHTGNAFVNDQAGSAIGDIPAGVVLGADGLGAHQRQALAARLGLSETVFVDASANASRRLAFFTPTQQIAHWALSACGPAAPRA